MSTKTYTGFQMSKQNEQKERKKNTCSQTSRLENPEELQLTP
jgi:hypothetical protein